MENITFPVVEKFVSINGESTRAGEAAVFIRFRGCNLSCSYCDTKWANTSSAKAICMTVSEITEYVNSTGIVNVTLTGGEPLLQENIEVLIENLIDNGHRVEIETNGSISIEKYAELKLRPVFTLDYKLPCSNMEKYMLTDNYMYLDKEDTIKFVAGSIEDLETAKGVIDKYGLIDKCHVYISPVFGSIDAKDIVDFIIDRKLNGVRLQLQLHKYIWDPDKRGV